MNKKNTLYIILFLCCNISNAQVSSKSGIHKPSTYTEPFDLRLFEKAYKANQQNPKPKSPISSNGVEVMRKYASFKVFPKTIKEGWHTVYAIGKRSDNVPFSCFQSLAKVEYIEGQYFISEFKIDGKLIDFELSGAIEKCKTNLLWICGKSSIGKEIYCGFDIYFMELLEGSVIEPLNTNKSNTVKPEEFYDGYKIVDFAKQVNFKPKNYTVKVWEELVIGVFAFGENSAAASKQINIEAQYLYVKQPEVIYRRYVSLYGDVERNEFNKNHTLYIILLKTDELRKAN